MYAGEGNTAIGSIIKPINLSPKVITHLDIFIYAFPFLKKTRVFVAYAGGANVEERVNDIVRSDELVIKIQPSVTEDTGIKLCSKLSCVLSEIAVNSPDSEAKKVKVTVQNGDVDPHSTFVSIQEH